MHVAPILALGRASCRLNSGAEFAFAFAGAAKAKAIPNATTSRARFLGHLREAHWKGGVGSTYNSAAGEAMLEALLRRGTRRSIRSSFCQTPASTTTSCPGRSPGSASAASCLHALRGRNLADRTRGVRAPTAIGHFSSACRRSSIFPIIRSRRCCGGAVGPLTRFTGASLKMAWRRRCASSLEMASGSTRTK